MRLRLSSAAALLLPLVLAAGASAAKVKIVWWDCYPTPPSSTVIQNMIDRFNASHPNISVSRLAVPSDGFVQKLAIAMTSGKAPDCANVWMWYNASNLWAMGLTLSMDAYMKPDKKIWDQAYPGFMDALKYRGKQLAFPDTAQTHLMYWNTDYFRQAGLDPKRAPKFEDLESYAAKLTKKDSNGKLLTMGMNPTNAWGDLQAWVSLFGGQLFDAAKEKVTADTPENLKALKWVSDFVKTHGGYPALNSMGYFWDGKMAMEVVPHYAMTLAAAKKPKFGYNIGLPPAPGGLGAGRGPMTVVNCNIVLRSSKHPREAYEFLRFFIDNGGFMSPDNPCPSPNRVFNAKFAAPTVIPEGTWRSVAQEALELARPAASLPGAELYLADAPANFAAVMQGKKSPEQALKALQVSGERYFNTALKRARWGK